MPLLLAVACGDATPTTPPGTTRTDAGSSGQQIDCQFSDAATLLVGGGTQQTGFIELQDGSEMLAALGPQGLFMVTPSVRAHAVHPGKGGRTGNTEDPKIEIQLIAAGGAVVGGSGSNHMGLTQTLEGVERLGVWAPFEGDVAAHVGNTITVRGSITDACGRTAVDELDVIVRQ